MQARKLLLLAATVITLVMALPRLIVIAHVKARSYPGAEQVSWWDFGIKSIFAFAIACLFLWLNTRRKKWMSPLGSIPFARFGTRLLFNFIVYLLIRLLAMQWPVLSSATALNEKFGGFLFNLSLLLEIIFCVLTAELYMLLQTNQLVKLKNQELEKLHAEARFEALKNKVNPHFLFNSLNTIHAMIDSQPAAARAFVSNMSEVYRHILSNAEKPVVPLAEELQFAKAYLHLLQERHAGNLLVKLDTSNDAATCYLPPASLQLLIENAVKHNIASARQPLQLHIDISTDRLRVRNALQPKKSKEPSTGTGLHNLNQRYLHICGQPIEIRKDDDVFEVAISLLKQDAPTGRYIALQSNLVN